MSLILTHDQQAAVTALVSFLASDNQPAFVLSGYAGTGKSTLVHHILDNIQKINTAIRLINPKHPQYEVEITATTNKAANNLAQMTGREVRTIHSFLGLRVETDYKTRETKLVPRSAAQEHNLILFIDEASYIDPELLELIFQKVTDSKIIFIGDPAQLIPVKASNAPVFKAGFPGAQLTQVMRQSAGNPILDLATQFRHTVNNGKFFSFTPDGIHVQHLPRDEFQQAIQQEFTRPDWSSQESKVLAWTNRTVEAYNKAISDACFGRTDFQVGDYVQCNRYFQAKKHSIKTDELVLITGKSTPSVRHGVLGHVYTLNHTVSAFCPDELKDKKALLKLARENMDERLQYEVEEEWIDLRTVYACTINKSQGSTYDRVFIDLDDIKRCTSGEQMARLLYVGTSRPRHQLFLTGDLV